MHFYGSRDEPKDAAPLCNLPSRPILSIQPAVYNGNILSAGSRCIALSAVSADFNQLIL